MTIVTLALSVVVVGTIVVNIARWIISRYHSHQLLKRYGIPGPKPNFFDGNLYQFKKDPSPHKLIDSWLKKYGSVFGYYMGGDAYIVVHDIEMIKQIMIKDFSVFTDRPDLYMSIKPFNKSMIGLKGQRWKEVRTIISPTFSTSKLKLMKSIFDKKVDITVDVVTKKIMNNEIFDIYAIVQGLTLDVIASSALAMNTRCQNDPNDRLLLALREFVLQFHNRTIDYGMIFPFLEKILAFANNTLTLSSKMNYLLLGNLEKVVAERRNNPELRSMDVLQLLLDNSDKDNASSTKLSEEEVIANAYLTLIAGYETTSTALAYTFYLLVKHPDIQERLYQEIAKAPDSSYTSLQGLHFCNQVLDESMRLYPPVTGFISRVCQEDHQVGSYTFPKGSIALIPVWQLHHDPDSFPDPYKFDPDRFSPENKTSIKSMSYMPFGEGPRNCVGARFAQLEMKLAIYKLLKKFKFEACEKTEDTLLLHTPTLATNPANPIWIRGVPRNLNSES